MGAGDGAWPGEARLVCWSMMPRGARLVQAVPTINASPGILNLRVELGQLMLL